MNGVRVTVGSGEHESVFTKSRASGVCAFDNYSYQKRFWEGEISPGALEPFRRSVEITKRRLAVDSDMLRLLRMLLNALGASSAPPVAPGEVETGFEPGPVKMHRRDSRKHDLDDDDDNWYAMQEQLASERAIAEQSFEEMRLQEDFDLEERRRQDEDWQREEEHSRRQREMERLAEEERWYAEQQEVNRAAWHRNDD